MVSENFGSRGFRELWFSWFSRTLVLVVFENFGFHGFRELWNQSEIHVGELLSTIFTVASANDHIQGDQIGRIFARLVIVYSVQFAINYRSSPNVCLFVCL
jgi:hypothetical protein